MDPATRVLILELLRHVKGLVAAVERWAAAKNGKAAGPTG
jgi:hypothetical protein